MCLHSCDTPRCVNPDHLRAGTAQDNSDDMKERDRLTRGSDRPLSKLDEEKVLVIRQRAAEGASDKALAQDFGVTAGMIRHIRNRRAWTHI